MEIFGRHLRFRTFWRDLRIAWHSLFARDNDEIFEARRILLSHYMGDPDVQKALGRFATQMPQASVVDDSVVADYRDWRVHFSRRLQGRGLEIGPLHRPMPRHKDMTVEYVDCHDLDELRRRYPELNVELVAPDILADAETLAGVADRAYDFVIAAHVLEHMSDPIGAILTWCRVLKPGGLLYLVLPDKRVTFDRARVRTTLEHMLLDHQRPSAERDFDHYLDYAVHVHRASGQPAIDEADRLLREGISIHYHVFLPSDVVGLVDWIAAHRQPLRLLEGPAWTRGGDEFHLLLELS